MVGDLRSSEESHNISFLPHYIVKWAYVQKTYTFVRTTNNLQNIRTLRYYAYEYLA